MVRGLPVWFLLLFAQGPQIGQAQPPQGGTPIPRTWFVQAGASGNGLDPASPLGSTEQIESVSEPGDIILLLPAPASLDGGLALKPRQILRGVPDRSTRPVITNTGGNRSGGVGVVLADGVRVERIEIRDTHASGLFGVDVGDVSATDVLIRNANAGHLVLDPPPFVLPLLTLPMPHGGVTLLTSRGAGRKTAVLNGVRVLEAAGMGVGAFAQAGSDMAVSLLNVEVRGGAQVGPADYGVAAVATGPSASMSFEMIRSTVSGRMSRVGRNVVVSAGDRGTTRGVVDGSTVGESGQDGVIATTLTLPASVELTIVGSTIENAAQSNVEGTFNAFPHEEADALASRMAISIHRSTIRGAGSLPGFEDRAANVNVTGSFIPRDQPLPRGRYLLRITDSQIESSRVLGLRIGTPDSQPAVDSGDFDVVVRGTRFERNQVADVMIGASNARVDARGNCWLPPSGPEGPPRVVTYWIKTPPPIDASEPVSCDR